jgi:hypothetical protein
MRRIALLLTATAFLVPAFGDSSVWLRNTDPQAVFLWWPLAVGGDRSTEAVLSQLWAVPGGPRMIQPGERVRLTVPEGASVVGAFVPPGAGYQTPVTGGFLLKSEFPSQGTVQADRTSFAAANRRRALTAPLQGWALVPSTLVLDGKATGWDPVPPVFTWGSGFQPPGKSWTGARPSELKVVDREGALWIRFTSTATWDRPGGPRWSLVLRRPGAFLEWPLMGTDRSVWLWNEGAEAQAVGRVAGDGTRIEGWVPWDRLSPADRRAWTTARGQWALLAVVGDQITVYNLGAAALGELP